MQYCCRLTIAATPSGGIVFDSCQADVGRQPVQSCCPLRDGMVWSMDITRWSEVGNTRLHSAFGLLNAEVEAGIRCLRLKTIASLFDARLVMIERVRRRHGISHGQVSREVR